MFVGNSAQCQPVVQRKQGVITRYRFFCSEGSAGRISPCRIPLAGRLNSALIFNLDPQPSKYILRMHQVVQLALTPYRLGLGETLG
jgi:hypothetical protein